MIVGDAGANSGNTSTGVVRLSIMSIRGNSANLCGLLTNWAAWLVDDDHVEYSDHGGAGIVMGSYLNNSKMTDLVGTSYYALQTSRQVVLIAREITGPGNNFGVYVSLPGLTIIGGVIGGSAAGASVCTNGNSISWRNVKCDDTNWINHGGTLLPVAAAAGGSVGAASLTMPPAPTSVALVSGTASQNTTGGDVILTVPVSFAANADSVAVARGSTSTPAPLGTITRPAGTSDVLEYYVPALWYFKATLGGTATFTANATAQPV